MVFAGCGGDGTTTATGTFTGTMTGCGSDDEGNLVGSVLVLNEGSEEVVVSVAFEYLLADKSSVRAHPETVTVAPGSQGQASFSTDVTRQQAGSFNGKDCEFSLLEMD